MILTSLATAEMSSALVMVLPPLRFWIRYTSSFRIIQQESAGDGGDLVDVIQSPKIDIDLSSLPFDSFQRFLERGPQWFSVYITLISMLRRAGYP